MMSPFAALSVTEPLLSNANVVSTRDEHPSEVRRRWAAASRAVVTTSISAAARKPRLRTMPLSQPKRVMRDCSCPRRQHRGGAEQLDLGVDRAVQRLEEEPAR